MSAYPHHISGFFAERAKADSTVTRLLDKGFPPGRLQILDAQSAHPVKKPESNPDHVLGDIVTDGAVGAAVGTGLGALGQLALTAANLSLFVASPLIGPLAMLGWGASLGAVVGAAVGAQKERDAPLSELIDDALKSGQVVLVAEARDEHEKTLASEVIRSAVQEDEDSRT